MPWLLTELLGVCSGLVGVLSDPLEVAVKFSEDGGSEIEKLCFFIGNEGGGAPSDAGDSSGDDLTIFLYDSNKISKWSDHFSSGK